jgi:hypothetical protein
MGSLMDGRVFALSVPGLEEDAARAAPPERLKRPVLGGCARPAAPRKLGSKRVLDGKIVCDRRTGRPLDLGGGDRLLAHQSLQGRMGKLILTRVSGRRKVVWSLAEEEWAGRRAPEEPGYRVAWASRMGGCVVLVLPVASGDGPLDLACVKPEAGRLLWTRSPP